MKKVWVLEELNESGEWKYCLGNNNYYSFCGMVIKKLREEDKNAYLNLKESLGDVRYSDEVKTQFKAQHNAIKDKFRVISAEIPDDKKISENIEYNIKEINEKVYKYLWMTK